MPNYKLGKVYKIVNDENDLVYIGSTVSSLSTRMAGHRQKSADLNRANGIYRAMRQLGVENFKILLIKAVPCDSKSELEAVEYATIEKYKKRNIELYNLNTGKGKLARVSRDLISKQKTGKNNPNFGKRGETSLHFKRGYLKKIHEEYPRWRFIWYVERKKYSRSFSIKKYGNTRAYKLAKQVQDEIYPISDSDSE